MGVFGVIAVSFFAISRHDIISDLIIRRQEKNVNRCFERKVRYTCEIIPNPSNRLNQMVDLYYNETNRGTFECFLEKHYT